MPQYDNKGYTDEEKYTFRKENIKTILNIVSQDIKDILNQVDDMLICGEDNKKAEELYKLMKEVKEQILYGGCIPF